MKVICYPASFPARPEDRILLQELEAAGVSAPCAELMLYRVWRDYSTGGSDRRDFKDQRQVRLLESACGWTGESGAMIRLAQEAGFLVSDGESVLVLKDFYPINSPIGEGGKSFQRKGALQRSVNSHERKAREAAGKTQELWDRNGSHTALTPGRENQALVFVYKLCGVALVEKPSQGALKLLLPLVDEVLASNDQEAIRTTLRWLISRRNDPNRAGTIEELIRRWPDFVQEAEREEG